MVPDANSAKTLLPGLQHVSSVLLPLALGLQLIQVGRNEEEEEGRELQSLPSLSHAEGSGPEGPAQTQLLRWDQEEKLPSSG